MLNTILDNVLLAALMVVSKLSTYLKEWKRRVQTAKILNIYSRPALNKRELVERLRKQVIERAE